MNQTEEHEFYSGLIIKIGARYIFFCNQEGHFRMECPLFWEAAKNQNQPKHKLALTAMQNTRNIQAENDLNDKEAASGELSTKTVRAVTQNKDATGAEKRKELRESSCRGDQQREARLGDQRNRTTVETENRKTEIK